MIAYLVVSALYFVLLVVTDFGFAILHYCSTPNFERIIFCDLNHFYFKNMFQPTAGVVCLMCHRSVLHTGRVRRVILTSQLFEENPRCARFIIEQVAPYQIIFNNNEFLCRPCWQRSMASTRTYEPRPSRSPGEQQMPLAEENQNLDQPQTVQSVGHRITSTSIELSEYSRSPNTSTTCIFFGCRRLTRHRVPESLKIRMLMDFSHYIPQAARVCEVHLRSNNWQELTNAPNLSHNFNAEQVTDLINIVKNAAQSMSQLDFDNIEQIDEEELHYLTGRTHEEFRSIVEQTPSLATCNRPNTSLAILLTKLRSGEPNERLSLIFHLSRRSLERMMKNARDALSIDFVPRHLGWDHINREGVVARNLSLPDALFGNPDAAPEDKKACVICDGTYVYIQKSSNFLFQRNTYSLHKFTNLLKPFLFVCSDGYIIEVTGPHAATTSDTTIIQNILNNEEHVFHWFFKEGDVFILDKGFRDAVPDLEAFGYEAHIPQSVERGEYQLTTMQANKSRMVTICRWVVEVVNGRFKRDYKLFREEYFNCAMNHMFEDFRIAAALINAFHDPITDNANVSAILERISVRKNMENILAEYVTNNNLNRQRVLFQSMTADLPMLEDFPRLSQDELILFALGTYQLKLARSYYSEHVRDGIYLIELCRDSQQHITELNNYGLRGNLLRSRIQSRHTRSRVYYSYILIDQNERGIEALNHYYCSCKSGKRTLGCCTHIMCIVWYLAWARFEQNIQYPADFLNSIIIDED